MRNFERPWSIEFDMHGGYDCMTSAYFIRNKSGGIITEIDTGTCGQLGEEAEDVINAKKIAQLIINSVNGVGCDANQKYDTVHAKEEQ